MNRRPPRSTLFPYPTLFRSRTPRLDLANRRWPIHTAPYRGPSARVITGTIEDSLLGEGSTVEDATVRRSIIGRGVRVQPGAVVEESVLLDHTTVGAAAQLRRGSAPPDNAVGGGARTRVEGPAAGGGGGSRLHVEPPGPPPPPGVGLGERRKQVG